MNMDLFTTMVLKLGGLIGYIVGHSSEWRVLQHSIEVNLEKRHAMEAPEFTLTQD
jgi:hypothetical protein